MTSRPRRRATQRYSTERRPDPYVPPEHSAMTPAGEIEGLGRFAQGVRSASAVRRRVAYAMVAIVVVPIVIGLVIRVVDALG